MIHYNLGKKPQFFEDGTDSRLELNIGERIEENLLDEFYFPPNNVQVSISFLHCTYKAITLDGYIQ